MRLRDDERAQSIQIGAVLLFAVLVVAFSSYQAFVVPNQNRAIEFNHNEQIRNQMQDLRNELVSIHGETATQSVSLTLGTQYPGRLVAVNPGPPSGTIRTAGTGPERVNLTLANAEADGETGDFWNGIDNRTYNTGAVVYQPNYNVYGEAPLTIYENSVLYNQFRASNLTASGQTLIQDERINLVTVNGSVSQARTGSTSLDLQPVSTSSTTVSVSNASATENLTIYAATQLPRQRWGTLLESQLDERGHVVDYGVATVSGSPFDRLWIELEPGVDYRLRMTKVGVGTGVTDESRAYLTDVAGNGTRLDAGDTTTVSLAVRDAYNNPVSDVLVNASSSNGALSPENQSTDGDGEVTFTYDSTGVSGDQWVDLNFSVVTDPGTSFDASTTENVTMQVRVDSQSSGSGGGGSDGAYRTFWQDPSSQSGVTCPNGPDGVCTLDASQTATPTLWMETTPVVDNGTVRYATNDTQVATVAPTSGTTNASGENSTVLRATEDGDVTVYTSSGGSGDQLVFEVVNTVNALVYNDDAVAMDNADSDGTTGGVEFTASNKFGQGMTITDVKVNETNGNVARLNDALGAPNDQPTRSELYVETDGNSGWVDINDGTDLPNVFDLDTDGFENNGDATASSQSSIRFYLYEFENNGGNRVDMTGQTISVTVFYRLDDGTTGAETFRFTVS